MFHKCSKLYNTLCEYYIYLTRCKKLSSSLLVFKYNLKFMFKVYKQITYTKQKYETFHKEWSPYLLLLNDIAWFIT